MDGFQSAKGQWGFQFYLLGRRMGCVTFDKRTIHPQIERDSALWNDSVDRGGGACTFSPGGGLSDPGRSRHNKWRLACLFASPHKDVTHSPLDSQIMDPMQSQIIIPPLQATRQTPSQQTLI